MRNEHLKQVNASPLLQRNRPARADVDDAPVGCPQLHPVAGRRQVCDGQQRLLDLSHLERDLALVALGRAERHVDLAEVLDPRAVCGAVAPPRT